MGEELLRQGFKGPVDVIDGNDKMLEVAKKKGIFRSVVSCVDWILHKNSLFTTGTFTPS